MQEFNYTANTKNTPKSKCKLTIKIHTHTKHYQSRTTNKDRSVK